MHAASIAGKRARVFLKNATQVVTVGGGRGPKVGADMGKVEVLTDHSLLVDGSGLISRIVPAGAPSEQLLTELRSADNGGAGGRGVDRVVDCTGKVILPGFVDGHTHAVFDGDRSHEHAMKLAGATYEEVHELGGGINFTVNAVRAASEERLLDLLLKRLDGMMRSGTTTVEVKSGYGLDFDTELKMLRVVQAARRRHRMGSSLKCTWLVHAVPAGGTSAEVTREVVHEQLPALARLVASGEVLDPIDFIDVFCEHGPSFFTPEDSRQILLAGRELLGAQAVLHGDELSDQNCGVLAAEVGARAVSHLEMLNDRGVAAMARGGVHAQLLPTTAYLLRLPLPPTRKLIESGAPVALASDFNPNAHCWDMCATMNLGCVLFKMTMPEALVAATINAASCLDVAGECGSLEVGKRGDLFILDAPSWEHLVYDMRPKIDEVFKDGVSVTEAPSSARWGEDRLLPIWGTPPTPSSSPPPRERTPDLSALAHGLPKNRLPPRISYDDDDENDDISIIASSSSSASASFDEHFRRMPHAPRRPVELTPPLVEKALANALRYFPERHHEELACDFVDELRRFGHIYMHRFAPRDAATGAYVMAAQPIDRYPAKSTQAAALMHMIQNNLDPTVAQFPAELVTYGGNGSAFSNWAQYHETMRLLAAMDDDQTLVLYSGHPMGLFPSHKDAPRLVVTNGMVVPNYSSREHYEEMFLTGVSSYGQMTAGSFCYIGPQGIVHGTVLTLLNAGRKYLGVESLRGKVFITAGLGGMSGAQPKAAVICGAVCICAEVSREAAEKRLAQGWVQEITGDLERCIEMASAASRERRGTSIAYVGNVVDLWERLAEKAAKKAAGGGAAAGDGFADSFVPDLGSDQTSCHIPFSGGYYPAGHSFEDGARMMAEDPAAFKEAVQESLRRQVAAVNKLSERGMAFWDYGNSFLLEASRAGSDIWEQSEDGDSATDVDAGRFRYPTYVQDIMGDIFSLGFGPFRWVCTSGQSQDLAKTDEIALQVLLEIRGRLSDASGGGSYAARAVPQLDDNILWIREAEDHKLVVGSQARILYANAEARSRIAQAFNEAVRDRRLEGPVMLSRDHHDVSGTDSPWRETSNVEDGSKFCADMAVQNVIGDACRGATSVSLHNGGGTGWGESINGGFLLCLDGSDDAARRARQMLHWDVFNGIARRAWAGNENALSYTAAEEEDNESFQVGYPNKVDSGVLQRAMAKAAAWLP